MTREEQFRRNLTHAFELFEVLLDEPTTLDSIPEGANIVPMPSDDADLFVVNEAMVRANWSRSVSPHGTLRPQAALSSSTLLVNV